MSTRPRTARLETELCGNDCKVSLALGVVIVVIALFQALA
jgi:hypothetical protein